MAAAIAAELRAVIARRQLRHGWLSEQAGIPKSTLSNLLGGQTAMDVDQLARICAVIGVEPAVIMAAALGSSVRPTDPRDLIEWLIANPSQDDALNTRLSELESRTGLAGNALAQLRDEVGNMRRNELQASLRALTPSPKRAPNSA